MLSGGFRAFGKKPGKGLHWDGLLVSWHGEANVGDVEHPLGRAPIALRVVTHAVVNTDTLDQIALEDVGILR